VRVRVRVPVSTQSLFNQQDDNDGGDDDDDEDDDFINDADMDTSQFKYRDVSFGLGRGRSAPSQRKAMGKSGSSSATVHVCTNCSAEYVKWVGRCSTCQEWNSVQEFKVGRRSSSSSSSSAKEKKARPVFGRAGDGGFDAGPKPMSWLTGIENGSTDSSTYQPVSITDVYKQMGYKDSSNGEDNDCDLDSFFRENRIQIPHDDELNNVLGGGKCVSADGVCFLVSFIPSVSAPHLAGHAATKNPAHQPRSSHHRNYAWESDTIRR